MRAFGEVMLIRSYSYERQTFAIDKPKYDRSVEDVKGAKRRARDIGAAVIGSGFIGTVHIEGLRRIGVQVHGLLGSSRDRTAGRAEQLGVGTAYADIDELLDDDRIEVVHVTSPNHLHHPQVKAILAAGRHVVCEKPLAMTSAESAELVRLADASDRITALNFNLRFYPINQHLRQTVGEGAIGEVRLVTGHYFQDWLLLDTDWNWRLEPEVGGALRAVGDIGSHWLDLASFVTRQRVESVIADLATFIPIRRQPAGPVETFSTERAADTVDRAIRTEDLATILLRFENGARGAVAISQISAGRKNSLQYEIDGSTGAAAWDSETPDHLWLGHRDRPNELLLRNPALMGSAGRAAAMLPAGHVEGFGDTFPAAFRAVYADILSGTKSDAPNYATFADGHEEMLIGDAILRSAHEGRWVDVERRAAVVAR
jgi:predicted dehydrogenase